MNRKKMIWLIAAILLILALALYLWWPVIFQRGNPIPYLMAAMQLSEEQPYVLVGGDAVPVYITKRGDCPELISMIEETRHVTFEEQAGSAWIFRVRPWGDTFVADGADRLMVSTEIYWRNYTVWLVPHLTWCTP